jgi:hypothetical protein
MSIRVHTSFLVTLSDLELSVLAGGHAGSGFPGHLVLLWVASGKIPRVTFKQGVAGSSPARLINNLQRF